MGDVIDQVISHLEVLSKSCMARGGAELHLDPVRVDTVRRKTFDVSPVVVHIEHI